MPATYAVAVDWDSNGTFGAGETISDDVYSITIDRGFPDYVSRVAQVGRCTIIVNNASRAYSPQVQSNVLPRRQVRVQMTYGTTVTLFRGFLESIAPDSGTFGTLRSVIECVDAIALLQLQDVRISLQVNQRGDQVIDTVVNQTYTPPGTAYDVDVDTFPFAADTWSDDLLYGRKVQRALVMIRDVCQSNWGWFYIRRDGFAIFENRHHRLLDRTSAATLDNTMLGLKNIKSVQSVFNEIEVTAHPRNVGTTNEVLWALDTDNTPSLAPNQTLTLRADFRDPDNKDFRIGGQTLVAPVATTDYTASDTNGGGGSSLTSNMTVTMTGYSNSADLVITNVGSQTLYITLLRIRGLAVRVYAPPILRKIDSVSQTAYQKRTLRIDAILQDDIGVAESQSSYLLGRYKDPLDEIGGVRFQANENTTLLAYARDIELGDRVTLTEYQTGTQSFQCFVQSVRHTIQYPSHEVEWNVEKADAGSFWILGTSLLGTTTALAY